MASHPLISVLTTTHNGTRFLPAAIDSILQQTWADFEYIIVDDCSTDETPALLQHYATQDARIKLIRNDRQLGPAAAANLGWQRAQGELIANIDHDDLATPDRLAKQIAFLQQHPSIGVLGATVAMIDEEGAPLLDRQGQPRQMRYPTSPPCTRWWLYFTAPLHHTVMLIRRDLMAQVGGYSPRYLYICDYEMEMRLRRITDMTNLPECLGAYRFHPQQASVMRRTEQTGMIALALARTLRQQLGEIIPIEDVLALHLCQDSKERIRDVLAQDPTSPQRALTLLDRVYTHFIQEEAPGADDFAWIHHDYTYRREFLQGLLARV